MLKVVPTELIMLPSDPHHSSQCCAPHPSVCAGLTQSPGTLTRWWACRCSALLFWSERGWVCVVRMLGFIHLNASLSLTFGFLQGVLQGCNSMCAGYLFQPDKQYDVTYDTGDKAIQCGRHVDIFKFWLMWKAKVWAHLLFYALSIIHAFGCKIFFF